MRWTPGSPAVALVDELAHTNAPGARNPKRWQDVELLLDAGIDVITTVNVQHLESLNDVVERITGVRQQETVPDEVVRRGRADRAGRHDARRRCGGGWRTATCTARRRRLRARQLLPPRATWRRCASSPCGGSPTRSTTGLEDYREDHGITEPWETRERVVVAVTGAPGSENVIRRARGSPAAPTASCSVSTSARATA